MTRMSRVFGLLLVVVLLGAAGSATAAKTKVVFATPHAPTGAPERVQVFMEKNPDIEVEILSLAGLNADQSHEKLYTLIAAGEQVDVIRFRGPNLKQWAHEGHLLDLTNYLRNQDEILKDMHPFALRGVTHNGRIYGLPEDPTTDWMIVNLAAFQRAGVPSPLDTYDRGDWTWDSMRTAARKLRSLGSEDDPFFPITSLLNNDLGVMPWIMGAGGEIVDETGTQVRIDSAETKRGLQFLIDLIDDGLINGPRAPIGWEPIVQQDRWGMLVWWVTMPSTVRQLAPDAEIDLVPLPRSPYHDAVPANINAYVILKTTKVPDAAFRLAQWLGGPEHYMLALTGKVHPNQPYIFSWPSAYRSADRLFIDVVGRQLGTPGVKYYTDVTPRAQVINQPAKASSSVRSTVYRELQRIFRKDVSLDAGLAALAHTLKVMLSN